MERYYLTTEDKEKFESFPMEITVEGYSRCCTKPRILVQSMEGGFVTANCWKCNDKSKISLDTYITIDNIIDCPKCNSTMRPDCVPVEFGASENYGLICHNCKIYIWISDLIPFWKDRMERK